MTTMKPEHRKLARHALGLPNGHRKSYRNHYVIDGGPTFEMWIQMVEAGDARQGRPSPITGGSEWFRLTRKGAEMALDPGERLCPEDFPEPQKEETENDDE